MEPVGGAVCRQLREFTKGGAKEDKGGLGRAGWGWGARHIEASLSKGVVNHSYDKVPSIVCSSGLTGLEHDLNLG